MAWYQSSLQEMKDAIEKEDWDTVIRILEEHDIANLKKDYFDTLDGAAFRIKAYHDKITEVNHALDEYKRDKNRPPKGGTITIMKVLTEEAINHAVLFERTMKKLIEEEEFVEKIMGKNETFLRKMLKFIKKKK